jgi:hypothetical protein
VRQQRAVAEPHHRVDDRLRVDGDLDPLVRHAEQEVGLDHLEPLVHQRGGVDRDLGAHRPGGMGERLLGRDGGQVGGGEAAKRAARGGDHQRLDGLRRGVAEALPERRMLAVDRHDRAVRSLRRGRHQRPAGDQALLVRQGQVGAGLERRQGRSEPGRTDDRVQHRVGAGVAHQLHHAGLALQHRSAEDRAGAGRGGRVDQRDPIHAVGGRRRDQRLGVGVRCERAGGQLGVVAHDLERLDADRAGRAENGDRLHPPHSTGGY